MAGRHAGDLSAKLREWGTFSESAKINGESLCADHKRNLPMQR